MSDFNEKSESISSGQSLPAVPEDQQPASAASSAAAQAKKVQSSIGACDACRLRKVNLITLGLAKLTLTGSIGPMFSKRVFHVVEMSAMHTG